MGETSLLRIRFHGSPRLYPTRGDTTGFYLRASLGSRSLFLMGFLLLVLLIL